MTTLHCMGCWAVLAIVGETFHPICPRCGSSDLIVNDGRPAFECVCGKRGHAEAGDLCPACGEVLVTRLTAEVEAERLAKAGDEGRPLS